MIFYLFALIVLACINVDANITDVSDLDGITLQESYKEMNAQLVREVPTDDVKSNKKVAEELLRLTSGANSDVHSAYQLFLSMLELDHGKRCDAKAINIIKQNELASCHRTNNSKILDSNQCLERVGKILIEIVENLIRECPRVYADLMRQKLEKFDPNQFELVEDATKFSIYRYMKDLNQDDPNHEVSNLIKLAKNTDTIMERTLKNGIWFFGDLNFRIKTLVDRSLAKFLKPIEDKQSGGFILNEEKFKELFERYGIKPCRDYVDFFGEDVFEPSIYLARFHPMGSENIDKLFYENWIKYNMCKGFIGNEQKLLFEAIKEAEYYVPSNLRSEIVNMGDVSFILE